MRILDRLSKLLNSRNAINFDEMDVSPLAVLWRGAFVTLMPKSFMLTAKMNNGFVIRGRNRAGFGGRGVYMFRDSVERELALLDLILAPGDTFIDVGACVGSYTVTAANSLRKGGGVIAIDPNPVSTGILKETLEINGLENVMLVCAAVSDTVGFTQFSVEDERPDSRHIEETKQVIAANLHRVVPTTTLDHITFEIALPGRVRMIKVDAEGAEDLVLKGGAKTIAKFHPVLILETAINNAPAMPGYIAHTVAGSDNTVLVHESDTEALEKLNTETDFAPLV